MPGPLVRLPAVLGVSPARRGALVGAVAALGSLTAALALAAPVLHERFLADPEEDLALGATTPDGALPAALRTKSGVVAAPDVLGRTEPGESPTVYGGPPVPRGADTSFRLDPLLGRPESVSYDEPFRPAVLPFKRLYAFDAVLPELALGVYDPELVRLPVGGSVGDDEDAFFADFEVDAVAGVPVRIPSVAAGARLRTLQVEPRQSVEVLSDGAENWFLRAPTSGRLRVMLQLSAERAAFGATFPPVGFGALGAERRPLPAAVQSLAERVLGELGLSQPESPAHALRRLVEHFRGFRPSDEPPKATDAPGLFVELALGQRGVCRHRAFAFTVLSQALGIPTRLVHNEAHAWVEVYDGTRFVRLDLGGAAARVEGPRLDPSVPTHVPPPEPFSWPAGERGAALLRPPSTAENPDPFATDRPRASQTAQRLTQTAEPVTSLAPSRRAGADLAVTLRLDAASAPRGRPVRVSGHAARGSDPCRLARVDLTLELPGRSLPVGSLASDEQGNFEGAVTIPRDAPVGQGELVAVVGAGCALGP